MWDIVEILLEIFGGTLIQLVLEVLGELAMGTMRLFGVTAVPDSQDLSNMIWSGLGSLVMGGIAGYWSSLLMPHRVLPRLTVSGPSVVLAPLCAGLAMHVFGRWRRRHGGHPTYLATFWGGGLFAFAMAAVRWWMVGR
jgi:hypothetical protein